MDELSKKRLNDRAKTFGFRGQMFTQKGELKKSYKEFYKKKFFSTPNLTVERTAPLPQGTTFNPKTNSFIKSSSLYGAKGALKKKYRDQGLISTRQGFLDYAPRNKTISGKVHFTVREFGAFKDKAGRKKKFRDFKLSTNFSGVPYTEDYIEKAKKEAMAQWLKTIDEYKGKFELKSVDKISQPKLTFGGKQLQQKDIRLRNLTIIQDGENRKEWEMDNNRCVVNYLNYLYKNTKLDKQFLSDEYFDEVFESGWKEEGVSTREIHNWCNILNIRMIALDQFNETIMVNNPENDVLKVPSLIFRAHNEHIFPIEDEDKRLKTSCCQLRENNLSYKKSQKKEIDHSKLDVEYVDIEKWKDGRWAFMCEKMVDKEVEILNENIHIAGTNQLKSFILQNKKYIFEDGRDTYVREFYENRNKKWDGKGISQHVNEILRENLKNIVSKPNQITNQILLSQGVKDRTHLGGRINDIVFNEEGEIDFNIIQKLNIHQYDIKKCHSSILTNPIEPWMIITWRDNWKPYKKGIPIKLGLYQLETDDKHLFVGRKYYSSGIVNFGLELGIIDYSHITHYIHASDSREETLFKKTFSDFKRKIIDMRARDYKEQNPDLDKSKIQNFMDNYEFNEFDVAFNKLMNNTTSGMLGKTTVKKYKTGISLDKNEAFGHLVEFDKEGLDVFSLEETVVRNEKSHTFHIFGNRKVIQKSEHNLPIYVQILDQQLIKLFQMVEKTTGSYFYKGVYNKGKGEVIYRNIDCVIVKNPKKVKTGNNWGDIHEEEINLDKTTFRQKEYRDDNIEWDNYVYSRNWFEVKSITDSRNAVSGLIELFNQNQGCCLEGQGGAGKSYVLMEFRKWLGWDDVAVVSFTGIASLNIRGNTFHSTFRLDLEDRIANGTLKHLKGMKAILVDEGSMVSSQLMNILQIARKELNIPIYFFLDWRQLPPLERGNNDILKNNERFMELCDMNYAKIEYNSEFGRYDEELYHFTKKFNSMDWFFKEGLSMLGSNSNTRFHITATNRKRIELNEIVMKREWENCKDKKLQIPIDPSKYFSLHNEGELEKEKLEELDNDYTNLIKSSDWCQQTYFFNGLQCVGMRTNKKLGVINGEKFEVVDIEKSNYKSGLKSFDYVLTLKSLTRTNSTAQEDKEYLERFPKREIKLLMSQWFSFMAPGYAMTCHKSQSQKISEPFTIWEIRHSMASEEWIYTGLTRAVRFKDINVMLI